MSDPESIKRQYYEILEREFRKAASISPNVLVKVIFGIDERKESTEEIFVAILSESNIINVYQYRIGSDDDDFYFVDVETGSVVRFDMPQDWLDLEESGVYYD
jgi:hypothetical protein